MNNLWKRFHERYPNANFSKFKIENFVGKQNIMFIGGDEEIAVFDDDDKELRPNMYFTKEMKQNLGLTSGFPSALTLSPSPKLVVPAISFDKTAHSLNDMLINLKIYVTPTDKFQINFRDIFVDTMLTHYSGKEARRWFSGPNMNLWNEQLNWAVWCSTAGCGISSRILFQDKMADGVHDLTDSELHLPPQIRSFFWFHTYLTIRRLLFEYGGTQNTFALSGDSTFNKNNNRYDLPSFKRLCNEFKIDPNTDLRFREGSNHALGEVFIYYSYEGYVKTSYDYPNKTMEFFYSGGKAEARNLIQYIENTLAKKQYEYFIPSDSHGLTSAGLPRINQSIEVFAFCILGAQVNARSGITGNSRSTVEVRCEFLALLEDSIRKPNISASIERFQQAIQEARVKLDLAISPGTWLLPARMVINTASKSGYNNDLRRASPEMRLGVNDNVNVDIKQTGIPKHNFVPSKNKLPHAIETETKNINVSTYNTHNIKTSRLINSAHEISLAVLTISAAGLAWFLFR